MSQRSPGWLVTLALVACTGQRAEDITHHTRSADAAVEQRDAELVDAAEHDAAAALDAASERDAEPVTEAAAPNPLVPSDAAADASAADAENLVPSDAAVDAASGVTGACTVRPDAPAGYEQVVSRPNGHWVAARFDPQRNALLRVYDGAGWGEPIGVGSGRAAQLVRDGTGRVYVLGFDGDATLPRQLSLRVLEPDADDFRAEPLSFPNVTVAYAEAPAAGGVVIAFLQYVTLANGATVRTLQLLRHAAGAWLPLHTPDSSGQDVSFATGVGVNAAGRALLGYTRGQGAERWLVRFDGTQWSAPFLAEGGGAGGSLALFANGDALMAWVDGAVVRTQRMGVSSAGWDAPELVGDVAPGLIGNAGVATQLAIDAQDRVTLIATQMPPLTCFGGSTRAYRKLGASWSSGTDLGTDGNASMALNRRGDVVVLTGSGLSGVSSVHRVAADAALWSTRTLMLPSTGGVGCKRVTNLAVDLADDGFFAVFPTGTTGQLLCL